MWSSLGQGQTHSRWTSFGFGFVSIPHLPTKTPRAEWAQTVGGERETVLPPGRSQSGLRQARDRSTDWLKLSLDVQSCRGCRDGPFNRTVTVIKIEGQFHFPHAPISQRKWKRIHFITCTGFCSFFSFFFAILLCTPQTSLSWQNKNVGAVKKMKT